MVVELRWLQVYGTKTFEVGAAAAAAEAAAAVPVCFFGGVGAE